MKKWRIQRDECQKKGEVPSNDNLWLELESYKRYRVTQISLKPLNTFQYSNMCMCMCMKMLYTIRRFDDGISFGMCLVCWFSSFCFHLVTFCWHSFAAFTSYLKFVSKQATMTRRRTNITNRIEKLNMKCKLAYLYIHFVNKWQWWLHTFFLLFSLHILLLCVPPRWESLWK